VSLNNIRRDDCPHNPVNECCNANDTFCGMIAVVDERFAMLYGAFELLAGMLSICAISSPAFSHASRLGDVVIVFVSFEDIRK